MAQILYSYAKYKGYDTTQGGMAVREFADSDKISDWAAEGRGLGGERGACCPAATATGSIPPAPPPGPRWLRCS